MLQSVISVKPLLEALGGAQPSAGREYATGRTGAIAWAERVNPAGVAPDQSSSKAAQRKLGLDKRDGTPEGLHPRKAWFQRLVGSLGPYLVSICNRRTRPFRPLRVVGLVNRPWTCLELICGPCESQRAETTEAPLRLVEIAPRAPPRDVKLETAKGCASIACTIPGRPLTKPTLLSCDEPRSAMRSASEGPHDVAPVKSVACFLPIQRAADATRAWPCLTVASNRVSPSYPYPACPRGNTGADVIRLESRAMSS